MHDLTTFLNELNGLKVDLYLHQQGLDTSTPTGRAMFQMIGVFAELERAIIRERVMSGLSRAKAEGKTLGRKRMDISLEREIERSLSEGDRGIRKIAREIGAGPGTVKRVRAALAVQRSRSPW